MDFYNNVKYIKPVNKIRINLYILKEILPLFFIGILLFSTILVIFQILKLSQMIFEYGISLETIFISFFLLVPPFLNFTIPISLFLATIIAFARLSSDEEYTAMNAVGISLFDLYPVVLCLSLVCFGMTAYASSYLDPWSKKYFNNHLAMEGKSKAAILLKTKLKAGSFIQDFFGQTLYVTDLSDQNSKLKEILLASKAKSSNSYIFSKEGEVIADEENKIAVLRLINGEFHGKSPQEYYEMMTFKQGDIDLVELFENTISFSAREITNHYQAMYPNEMIRYIESKKKVLDHHYYRAIFLLNQKLSLPFACIIFGLFGMPLGLQGPRSGKSRGYVVGIITILVYYLFIMIAKNLAERGLIDPILASWGPNIFFMGAAVFYFHRRNQRMIIESPMFYAIEGFFFKAISKLKNLFFRSKRR